MVDENRRPTLRRAIADARKRAERHLQWRRQLLEEYAGPRYGVQRGTDSVRRVPINALYFLAATLVPLLAYRSPQALIEAKKAELRQHTRIIESLLNRHFEDIKLAKTLQRVVLDSIFGPGVMIQGLGVGGEMGVGEPFVDRVSPDDYFLDPLARDKDEATFEGDRLYLLRESMLSSPLFEGQEDVISKLPAKRQQEGKRAESIGGVAAGEPYAEIVEVERVFFPERREIQYVPATGESEEPLATIPFEAPVKSPYLMYGMNWVPDNPYPLPLGLAMVDAHELVKQVGQKIGEQAKRQKRVLLADATVDETESDAIQNAPDGSLIRVQSVDRYREVDYGGASKDNYDGLAILWDQFSRQAGNMDLMSGAKAQSETLGQDQMLYQSASLRVDYYASQLRDVVREICRGQAWYIWSDPVTQRQANYEVQGLSVSVDVGPGDLEGEFEDYVWDIEPYSMGPDDPKQQFVRTLQWFQNVALPAIQASPDVAINGEAIMKATAKMADIPYADEFVQPMSELVQQVQQQAGMVQQAGGQARGRPAEQERGQRLEQPNA